MPRLPTFGLYFAIFCLGLMGFALSLSSTALAQVPTQPDYPLCPVGSLEVLKFGPDFLHRPDQLQASFDFNLPANTGPAGQVLVWQGEGHLWDEGCTVGPDNDGGVFPCDQNQLQEIITFTVNSEVVGQFIDHSPDDDNIYFYEFDLDQLVEGSNVLGLNHINEGEGSNSVFYKGVVCAAVQDVPLGEVGNYVWLDANQDGIQNDGGSAAGVENVTVHLHRAADNVIVQTTQTAATGAYLFPNLEADTYYVAFELPTGYAFTQQDAGANDELDSDADPNTGLTSSFALGVGESNLTLDAGLILLPDSNPGIAITKFTNGEDADTPTGPSVEVGSTVTWTYEVRNTGDVPLSDIDVTDNIAGVLPVYVSGDTNENALLDLTEVWLFRATGIASTGQYANIGTVVGIPPDGVGVTDSNPSHYFGTPPEPAPNPGIAIIKFTNGEDADTPTGPIVDEGSTVTWTYEVRNTGNVPLSGIDVTDNVAGVSPVYVSGDTNDNALLDLTEVWLFRATGVASTGQYVNIGTVVGTPPDGVDVTDSNPSHYFGTVVLPPVPPTALPVDGQPNLARQLFLPLVQSGD